MTGYLFRIRIYPKSNVMGLGFEHGSILGAYYMLQQMNGTCMRRPNFIHVYARI